MDILWLSAYSCNGNVHSFLNYPNLNNLLEKITFSYHPILESNYTLKDVFISSVPCDILIIDGTIDEEFKKFDTLFINKLLHYASKAKHIITVGTCATYGGMFLHSGGNKSGFLYKQDKNTIHYQTFYKKTISLPGCPVHPDTLANLLFSLLKNYNIKLDEELRPKEFYSFTVHNGCIRNEYFEYKIDNFEFGNIEGCMFYENGCQAPYTKASCNKILWNETNSKTRNGQPCFGCTMPNFPKENLFDTKKNMGIPQNLPLGIPKRAYLSLAGVAKTFKIERFYTKTIYN